jgi:hypothetical protein
MFENGTRKGKHSGFIYLRKFGFSNELDRLSFCPVTTRELCFQTALGRYARLSDPNFSNSSMNYKYNRLLTIFS